MDIEKSSASRRKAGTRPGKRLSRGAQKASSSRRIGSEHSKTRTELLNAAEALMRKEGYAAVTSRRVAKEAKLTPQLVHYYFHTMDDLFLALWRRFVQKNLANQAQALRSAQPLRALWDFARQSADISLETEFLALAHHRKSIRDEIANDGDSFRRVQFDLLSRELPNYGPDDDGWSIEIGVVLLTSIARALIMEQDLGMSAGHRETFEYIDRLIDRLNRRANECARQKGPRQSRVQSAQDS